MHAHKGYNHTRVLNPMVCRAPYVMCTYTLGTHSIQQIPYSHSLWCARTHTHTHMHTHTCIHTHMHTHTHTHTITASHKQPLIQHTPASHATSHSKHQHTHHPHLPTNTLQHPTSHPTSHPTNHPTPYTHNTHYADNTQYSLRPQTPYTSPLHPPPTNPL